MADLAQEFTNEINKIEEQANLMDQRAGAPGDTLGKICAFVPIILPILGLAKIFLGPKAKEKLEQFINILKTVC